MTGTSSVASRIGRATAILMASVLLSRILGFARDAVIAAVMGANARTDVYFAAFTIPDFLNHLVAGGALSITFIPIFSRYLAENREDEGWHVFSTVVTLLAAVLSALTLAAEIFAEPLARLVTQNFTDAQYAELARLTRILLPAQLCFVVGGILMAVQYSKESFLGPALAPLIYNAGIIVGGASLGASVGMEGFAWGALFGSIVGNFGVQIVFARRIGLRFSPRFDVKHPAVREFLLLSLPLALGLSLTLVDDWVTRWMASSLGAAAISVLAYGRTLMRIPLAAIGQTTGSASFPILSRLVAAGRMTEFREALAGTMRQLLVLMLPAMAVTIACSREIAFIVYCRGNFTVADALETANVLVCYAAGLTAWGVQTIVARGYYAMRDTVTPTWVGTACTFGALPIYWLLMNAWGLVGLAIASSISITIYAAILYAMLERRLRSNAWRDEIALGLKLGAAALLAGLGALGACTMFDGALKWTSLGGSAVRLAIGLAAAGAIYLLSTTLMGVRDPTEIARALLRRVRRK